MSQGTSLSSSVKRRSGRPLKTLRPCPSVLKKLYLQQGLSLLQIANRLAVSEGSVNRWMRYHKIPVRIPGRKPRGTTVVKSSQPTGRPRGCHSIRPPIQDLVDLYVAQGLTSTQIATRYNVSRTSVCAWLRYYGIAVRKPSAKPSADELKRLYVDQELTSRQIATMLGVDRNRLLAWLTEYDITRHGVPGTLLLKGIAPPSKKTLYDLVHRKHKTFEEIGQMFGGVTKNAVMAWLNKLGIRRPKTWLSLKLPTANWKQNWVRYTASDGHIVRSKMELRVDDWLSSHGIEHECAPKLPFSNRHRADFKVGDTFVEIWGVRGSARYDATKRWKKRKYKKYSLHLLELTQTHFDRKDHNWEAMLAEAFLPKEE